MSQLTVVMLALFGQTERSCAIGLASRVHAVAAGKCMRNGRLIGLEQTKLAYAADLRDQGLSISAVVQALQAAASLSVGQRG